MAGNIRYQHLYHAQGSICSYVRARSLQFELEKKNVVDGGGEGWEWSGGKRVPEKCRSKVPQEKAVLWEELEPWSHRTGS